MLAHNKEASSEPSANRLSIQARFAQADKEACISLCVYLGYLLWWIVCAYGLGSQDPETYTYIFGLPAWFFYACVVGYPLLTLVLWLVVRFFFQDMSLEDYDDDDVDDDSVDGNYGNDKGAFEAANTENPSCSLALSSSVSNPSASNPLNSTPLEKPLLISDKKPTAQYE